MDMQMVTQAMRIGGASVASEPGVTTTTKRKNQ
jgi:hypothetical protein